MEDNSARHRQKTSNKRSSRFYLRRRNLINQQQEFDEELTSHENMITKEKQRARTRHHESNLKNSAKKSYHKSKHVDGDSGPSYVTKSVIGGNKRDHVIGGNVQSLKLRGSVENDETDIEHSGYSMMVIDTFPTDDELLKKHSRNSSRRESAMNRLIKMTILLPVDDTVSGKETKNDGKVHVGKSRTEPIARDSRRTFYPKDRGKFGTVNRRGNQNLPYHSNRKHSKVSSA